MSEPLPDAAGRRRSPARLPEFHAGPPPRNKGMRYPADPPTIEEIATVMRSDMAQLRKQAEAEVTAGLKPGGVTRRPNDPRRTRLCPLAGTGGTA